MSRSDAWQPGDTISWSQLYRWTNCSAAYIFDRVFHLPAPEVSYFLLGGVLHLVAERVNRAKLAQTEIPAVEILVTLAREEVQARIAGAIHGVKFSKDETAESLAYDAERLTRLYVAEVAPKIQPLLAEERITIKLPSGTPCTVVLDVVDQHGGIRDLKTGKSRWPEGTQNRKPQGIIYHLAYRERLGVPPPYVAYDILIRKKASVEYQPLKAEIDPRLEYGILRWLDKAVEEMKAGAYAPQYSPDCDDCPYQAFCLDHFVGRQSLPKRELRGLPPEVLVGESVSGSQGGSDGGPRGVK
jgi:hypothetical protein